MIYLYELILILVNINWIFIICLINLNGLFRLIFFFYLMFILIRLDEYDFIFYRLNVIFFLRFYFRNNIFN